MWLPAGREEGGFCARAAESGLILQPLGKFCHCVSLPPVVIIGYTAQTLAQIRYHGRLLTQWLIAA
ncbi:hypothetical protein RJC98_28715 [Pseudomonas allii]|uniref:Uncharacterized protein n=1 Tax=Pseudomonas allii TaxID=2740531 RepID=A0ACC6LLU3_9PSED|nr:hypothetical protein [Pseudomonas allii]MDR9879182.1 hypothetical protein [Pseudomonas allii]